MGYRLNIDKIENGKIKNIYYGTKLYGYCDEADLLSFIYLNSIGKVDYDQYFNYGSSIEITLDQREFTIFANLYELDLKNIPTEIWGGHYEEDFDFLSIKEIADELLDSLDDYRDDWNYLISWN